jgi:rhomboid family GlyGly-CTERM serine protease
MHANSRSHFIRLSSFPIVTVALTLAAIALQAHDQLGDWVAYDRAAIQNGEVWRLFTGHLTHYNTDHLLWDVVMFLVLGVMIERRHRAGVVTTIIASATAITSALWLCHPAVAEYRGLSGIDSALFTLMAIVLYRDGRRSSQPLIRLISAGLLVALAAKLTYEMASGNTLFVDSDTAGFTALPAVHLTGGITGIAVGTLAFISREDWKKFRGYFSRCAFRCATTSRISS